MTVSPTRCAPTDPLPGPDDWRQLSVLARKRRDYPVDLHFREGWAELVELRGDAAAACLHEVAMVSFKPDGVVGRRMTATLDFARRHGFRPVASALARLDRNGMRALWRWNWNLFPVDRLQLSSWYYAATGTVVVLLRRTEPDPAVPATVHFSSLKGPVDKARRRPDQLRSVLGSRDRLLNFVHTADEPADLVRELAVFFDRADRTRLLATATDPDAGPDPDLTGHLTRLERAHPAHDLDPAAALGRLARRPGGAEPTAALAAAIAAGEPIGWAGVRRLADPADPDVDLWDVLSAAAPLLEMERGDCIDLLAAPTVEDWLRATR